MGLGSAKRLQQAWRAYDSWLQDDRIGFLEEPTELEKRFKALTCSPEAHQKEGLIPVCSRSPLPLIFVLSLSIRPSAKRA